MSRDGGDAVVEAFLAAGAECVFSSPGSEWSPVWESLARRHRDDLPAPRYFDLTHETVAVGMATGFALVTRRAQGVLLHAGPGLLQGACAIHGALLSGAPMVVASSESLTYGDGPGPDPGGQWYRNLSVVGGPHTMAAPFVKWAGQAGSVDALAPSLTRAMELAGQAPAGPVYLNVPLEVLLTPWSGPSPRPVAPRGSSLAASLDEAVALLAEARQAVIVTETAGREAGGLEALVAFASAWGIPVVEPQSAVCANFPRTHPLHAGGELEPFMDSADLIVLVNCRAPFYPPSRRPAHAKVLVIDEVPHRPHIAYQVLHADLYLTGGVPATLLELAGRAAHREVSHPAAPRSNFAGAGVGAGAVARAGVGAGVGVGAGAATSPTPALGGQERSAGVRHSSDLVHRRETDGAVDPALLAATLRETVADDAILVDETITHSRLVARHWRAERPDSYFYVQGGLGQGMAVALGVRLAAPERPVVLTIGDGAFLYNPVIPSLEASRSYGLPLLIVVLNNREYRSMRLNHLRFYPDGAAVETGEFLGSDLTGQPSLAAFAEPFGMHGETVTDPEELAAALSRAWKSVRSGTTAIVNVHVTR